MLREGSHGPCRRRRPFGSDATHQRVSCACMCRGRPTRSCCSGAARRFTSQSPLQPGWAAMLVSGRVGPRLRSRAVGRRGGGALFAADSGAGRWRALNSAHGADVGRRTLSTALLTRVPVQVVGTLGRRGHTAALGSPLPHRNQDLGSPLPHLRQDWAQPCPPSSFCRDSPLHLTAATSAPGLGSPLPHLRLSHTHTHMHAPT